MFILRAGTERDIEGIAEVWYRGWRDGHLGHVPEALLPHRERGSFVGRVPERLVGTTVAVVGERVVGFVTVSGDELEQLYVDAEVRGRGVAVGLIRHGERVIGARFGRAWLAVVAGNARARRFYAREGWVDRGPFAYAAQLEGGTVMVPCHRYEKAIGLGGADGGAGACGS